MKDLTSSKTSYLQNIHLSFSWCKVLFIFKLKILSWRAGVVFFLLPGNYVQIPTPLSNYSHLWHFRQCFWGRGSSLNEWQLVSFSPLYFENALQPLSSPSDPLFFIFGSSRLLGSHFFLQPLAFTGLALLWSSGLSFYLISGMWHGDSTSVQPFPSCFAAPSRAVHDPPPPTASACAKNIRRHHRVAVNLTFCIRALGMKALISSVQLFLNDPSSPGVCVCTRACVHRPNDTSQWWKCFSQ